MRAAPEWLAQRGGSLKPSTDGQSSYLMLNGQPLYAVIPTPVKGRFGCAIVQANNGQRIDIGDTAASADDALRLGLEHVRQVLGW
jgi:hypothetical protein